MHRQDGSFKQLLHKAPLVCEACRYDHDIPYIDVLLDTLFCTAKPAEQTPLTDKDTNGCRT